MNYEDAVLDFLSKEENLLIALEVSERIEQLKIRLHEEFWFTFRSALQDTLTQSRWSNEWEVRMTVREALLKDYASCLLVPRSIQRDQRYLRFGLQQGTRSQDYPLSYGIVWNKALGTELNIKEVDVLADKLRKEGFRSDSWWIGYKYLNYYPPRKEFLLRMAANRDEFIQEMIELLRALFEGKYPLIEGANAALGDFVDTEAAC